MSEVKNVQVKTTLNADEQLQLQTRLKKAKNAAERESIYNTYLKELGMKNSAQPESKSVEIEKATKAEQEANKTADAIRQNPDAIRQLPDEYKQKYIAANGDENKEREVIKEFSNDPKYNKEVTTIITKKTNQFGNRNSVKNEGGIQMFTEYDPSKKLIDEDGKPIKENVETRFENVKKDFSSKMDNQINDVANNPKVIANLVAIDNDTKIPAEDKQAVKELAVKKAQNNLVINEVLNSSFKPQVDALIEENKSNSPTSNKNTYYHLVMDNIQKEAVNGEMVNQYTKMEELINKPEKELTADDKKLMQQWKDDFNAKFSKEEEIGEEEHLWKLNQAQNKNVISDTKEKLKSLAQMYAIEKQLGGTELNAQQQRELAKAQIKETITHEDEISELSKTPGNEARIKKLSENRDKMIKDIKKGMVANQAQAQVEFETYKQNYENTSVHWNKDGANNAKGDGKIHTHLNDYAKKLIKEDPKAFGCDSGSKEDHDFEADGKYYKFNSNNFKAEMLRLSNTTQKAFENTGNNADYFASTSEWADFANEHAKKGDGKPATMGERKDAREMFKAAGIQVSKDRTYLERGKNIGLDALKGAGAGALAGIGGELMNQAQKLHYSGTALGIAQGVASQVITGVATGKVSGVATDTITVNGQSVNTFESTIKHYDPYRDKYITVGHQVTKVPVDWTKDVDVSIDYETDASLAYEKRVDIPYEQKDVPADYAGSVKDSFDWGNVGKLAGIGAATGAGFRALKYLFKHKTNDDYVNNDSKKEGVRTNTGYQKSETVITNTTAPKGPVQVAVETEKKVVTPVTKEIPQEKYKLQAGETISAVICGKYDVKYNSPEYKAILKYVRETANGLKSGEIPKGDAYNLPKWIPGDVLGDNHEKIDLKMDGTVAKTKYEKVKYNSRDAKNSGTFTDLKEGTIKENKTDTWDIDPEIKKRK